MKLKRLVIQGFKSFKDRTTVHFDQGITGIVGPNGCGKSNIVDALFWVMGEQSAKHLRGKSMQDLIFAGSSKYAPASFAEASLILENTEGKHIHIGHQVVSPTELALTRKLYRNGETQYRINGMPCRLRDIQEVFMDTGAGAKSYSIIAQGEIDRLVHAKPEERRVMVEEVAGITKFKVRKRESLKKMEQTQANLGRLDDLKMEIENSLHTLKNQSRKAQQAKNLKQRLEESELIVTSHKVYAALKNFQDSKKIILEKNLDIQNWKVKKNTLEVNLESERLRKNEHMIELEELQKQYNILSRNLAASEERMKSLLDSRTEKERQVKLRSQEVDDFSSEMENRLKRLESLRDERRKLEEKSWDDSTSRKVVDRIEDTKKDIELKDTESNLLKDKLSDLQRKQALSEQELLKNKMHSDGLEKAMQDVTDELKALQGKELEFSQKLAAKEKNLHSIQKNEQDLIDEERQLKKELLQSEEELKELKELFESKSKEVTHTKSTLDSLREFKSSFEGTSEGTKNFLSTPQGNHFSILGNAIQCDEIYSKGVQAVLGQLLDTLVENKSHSSFPKEWPRQNPDKGISVLAPLPSSQTYCEKLVLEKCGEVKALSEIVRLPQELKALLAGLFLVERLDLDFFEKIHQGLSFRSLATFDGRIVINKMEGAKTFCVLNPKDHSRGIIERNNRIQKMDASLVTLKKELDDTTKPMEQKEREILAYRESLETVRSDITSARTDRVTTMSALALAKERQKEESQRQNNLEKKEEDLSKTKKQLQERRNELSQKIKEIQEQVTDMEHLSATCEENLDLLKSNHAKEKERFLATQFEKKSSGDRLSSINFQMEDIKSQIERHENRIKGNRDIIENLRKEVTQVQSDADRLEKENHGLMKNLREKEHSLAKLKDALERLVQEMKDREDKVKRLEKKIDKTEKEVISLEGKLDLYLNEEERITRDIFEKYRINLRHSIGGHLGYENDDYRQLKDIDSMEMKLGPYRFQLCEPQKLKQCEQELKTCRDEIQRLGEINWQAVKEYEKQNTRYDFLQEQERELKQSLQDLEDAIDHIDGKSKERFKMAFSEINANFEKVFPLIFGGGSANLNVKGDIDDPECGVEIIAQPPGKKMQNINLMSGGEKALTAVVLIFSIFLVKPSPFCLLDEVDAPLDDANVGRFNEVLREMSEDSQFILVTHNKKTMELNDTLYGVTMQEPGISKAVSVQLH